MENSPMAPSKPDGQKRAGWRATVQCGLALAIGGCMNESKASSSPATPTSSASTGVEQTTGKPSMGPAMVRYQIGDIERAIAFYTGQLGFTLEQRNGPVFATVALGNLRLLLSGPGSSGARPLPDGRKQEPGGWNRIVISVDDLTSRIDALRRAGARFRNEIEVGPGGRQIQIEDPDGNPVELHEPRSGASR
jgi:glyoxylase I family protein